MASLVVADTDLLIDFLRARGPGAAVVRELVSQRRLRLTAVTAFELRVGTDFMPRQSEIIRLFRARTLELDLASAVLAGEVATALRASGQPIGLADCLQAGICLRHRLPLATRNVKHFGRVAGLELVHLLTPPQ